MNFDVSCNIGFYRMFLVYRYMKASLTKEGTAFDVREELMSRIASSEYLLYCMYHISGSSLKMWYIEH